MNAAVSTAASVDLAQIFTRHGSDWLESHYAETRHRKVMAAAVSYTHLTLPTINWV